MLKKIRFMILVSHPIQYFVPVYRILAKREGLDFSVIYRSRVGLDTYYDSGFGKSFQWDVPLLDGYKSDFLSNKADSSGTQWGVVRKLLSIRPDVILLHGYNSYTNLLAILTAKALGIKVLMRGDTRKTSLHEKSRWKQFLKRMILKCIDGCVAIGKLNRQYYEELGVNPEKIYFSPFCIDNDSFNQNMMEKDLRINARKKLSISSESKVVLFVAKLIKRKRAIDLVSAMELVHNKHPHAELIIVGSGQEEDVLRKFVLVKQAHVRFLGFKNQSELPEIYAASDIFVLPAESEPWGLVVNEAMAAGLPIIVTDDVGAAPDLVEGKNTGFVYPVGDICKLAEAIDKLLSSPEQASLMGTNAKKLIKNWDVIESADGIEHAVHKVLSQ